MIRTIVGGSPRRAHHPHLGLVAAATSVLAVLGTCGAAAVTSPQDTSHTRAHIVMVKVPDASVRTLSTTASATATAADHAQSRGVTVTAQLDALGAFTADLSPTQVNQLRNDPAIALVAPDLNVEPAAAQTNPPWHLDRIDQTSPKLDQTYQYSFTGKGTHIYILDTGIRATHQDFAGRIGNGENFTDQAAEDVEGHGTHVAGMAAGTIHGPAKDATIHALKVLRKGPSPTSAVVKAMDWILKNGQKPGVANLSLTTPGGNPALDEGVIRLIDGGYTTTIAAGNYRKDACAYSPANVAKAVTVGNATHGINGQGTSDGLALGSNFGKCVDISAPGDFVTSAWFTDDKATHMMGGTSMASPLVAGVIALYLEKNPQATPDQVQADLVKGAQDGAMGGLPEGHPNKYLNTGFLTKP